MRKTGLVDTHVLGKDNKMTFAVPKKGGILRQAQGSPITQKRKAKIESPTTAWQLCVFANMLRTVLHERATH